MTASEIHGRDSELDRLSTAAERALQGTPQMVVLFGRRRVGKTYLIHHFLARVDGAAAYCAASRLPDRQEVAQVLLSLQEVGAPLYPAPTTWGELFDALVDLATEVPVVLALDEVPYLVEGNEAWPSILQRAWDRARHLGRPCKLLLVIAGSAISTMTGLISSQGALFERPDDVIRLDPFDLPTTHRFLGAGGNPGRSIEAFAACGGYPLLLQRWDAGVGAEANLTRLAADPFAPLVANASTLLLDITDTVGLRRTLIAVGRGASRRQEIDSRSGQRADRTLSTLVAAGFVRETMPIGETTARLRRFTLDDGYLRFWFSVIERDLSLICRRRSRHRRATTRCRAILDPTPRLHVRRPRTAPRSPPRPTAGAPGGSCGRQVVGGPTSASRAGHRGDGREPVASCGRGEVDRAVRAQRLDTVPTEPEGGGRSLCRSRDAHLALWCRGGVAQEILAQRPELRVFTPADMVV